MLVGLVGAALLLIAGVAAAAGGLAPSDDVSLSTSSPDETTAPIDTTTVIDETTMPGDETTVTEPEETTTTVTDGDDLDDEGDGGLEDETESTGAHPDNFGGTISSMRHAGDHTPAAIVKGKDVPGWQKNHPSPGTTTTEAAEPTEPDTED